MSEKSDSNSLKTLLSVSLPKSTHEYQVLNIQTIPREGKPLIQKPNKLKPSTIKIVHFITLFHNKIPVFAIELYVYLTISKNSENLERTIYVSKADTTGLSGCETTPKLKVGTIVNTIMQWLLSYPIVDYIKDVQIKHNYRTDLKSHPPFKSVIQRSLHILAERHRIGGNPNYGIPVIEDNNQLKIDLGLIDKLENEKKITTKIVLFTRSEPQYLFPNSNKNKGKHLLSDEQLLKWWLRTLNKSIETEFSSFDCKCLNILNSESRQISKFFPSDDWEIGDVFSKEENLNELAVHCIPLLPDDPKGRFLEHLVVENRINKVKLKQFWTELSIRQEFRLGIIVGLIGIKGIAKHHIMTDKSKVFEVNRKIFSKIRKIITEADYSDKEDAAKVFENIEAESPDLESAFFSVNGELEVTTATSRRDNETSHVNTINAMSVRSKKRKPVVLQTVSSIPEENPVIPDTPVVNNLTSLVKRKKVESNF